MNKLKKITNNLFSDIHTVYIYLLLVVFNVFVIGIFGIGGGLSSYFAKQVEIKRINDLNTTMQTKLDQLKNVGVTYKQASDYIPLFDPIMPVLPSLGPYLTTFVIAIAEQGFYVRKFDISPGDSTGTATISAEIVGDPWKVPEFLSIVENLKRVSNVASISFNYDTSTAVSVITSTFDIYYMEKNK